MLNYQQFYNLFGIKRYTSLINPKIVELTALPNNSIFHWLTYNEDMPDVDLSKIYFNNKSRRAIIDIPDNLITVLGGPRKKQFLIRSALKNFISSFNVKLSNEDLINSKEQNSIVLVNYNYLNLIYKYIETPLSDLFKFENIQNTFWTKVNDYCAVENKYSFILINLPKEVPGYSALNAFSRLKKDTPNILKIFNNNEKLFLLEIWKWINPELRDSSTINFLKPENYSKVNLIFSTVDNKTFVLNLGKLNSWIKYEGNNNETDLTQLDYTQVQKLFLKFLIVINENIFKSELDEENKITNTEDVLSTTKVLNNNGIVFSEHEELLLPSIAPEEIIETEKDDINLDSINDDIESYDHNFKEKQILIGNKDKELLISKTDAVDSMFKSNTPEDSLKSILDELIEGGLYSTTEGYKLEKILSTYKDSISPFSDSKTIAEDSKILDEELSFNEEEITMVGSENIIDKTMLKSSLLAFDKKYIKNVLHKDILNVFNYIQKSGVIIKKHTIESKVDILGGVDTHIIELKPLDGYPSTLKIRLPKINQDGSFLVNGNKYSMRKQRVD